MLEDTCEGSGQQALAASGCFGLLPLSNSINCFTHMQPTQHVDALFLSSPTFLNIHIGSPLIYCINGNTNDLIKERQWSSGR